MLSVNLHQFREDFLTQRTLSFAQRHAEVNGLVPSRQKFAPENKAFAWWERKLPARMPALPVVRTVKSRGAASSPQAWDTPPTRIG
jgi:hypothetical protein